MRKLVGTLCATILLFNTPLIAKNPDNEALICSKKIAAIDRKIRREQRLKKILNYIIFCLCPNGQ
jgi:hypothetical protein